MAIGRELISSLGERVRGVVGAKAAKAAVVADSNLPADLLSRVDISLSRAGFFTARIGLEASEEKKSLKALEGVLGFLASMKLERDEPVVAIGGGIVGDLAGFAAAVHRRGCPVVQVPTTLLAMVDASVGGKTGVNLPVFAGNGSGSGSGGGAVGGTGAPTLLKNAVGAFHQPHAVVVSIDTLATLEDREFRGGLAECVKHAMLSAAFGDAGLMEWTVANMGAIVGGRNAPPGRATPLAELIARNVAIKARVVEGDEREEREDGGSRMFLNLGHTFGHAIETLPGLSFQTCEGIVNGPLLHGEAVGLGLLAATRTAVELGRCPEATLELVRKALAGAGLPVRVEGLPLARTILERMRHDKKVARGKLRLVLPNGEGRAEVVEDAPAAAVLAGLSEIERGV